jgi:hypothetical protein
LSIAVFTADAEASLAGLFSHSQPGHPQPRIDPKHPVQVSAHLTGQQVSHQLRRQVIRPLAGRPDHLRQHDRAGPDHLHRRQVLARQVEQQRRRVVLHGPVEEELLQLLHLLAASRGVFHPRYSAII